jgi:hypothetical protein
MKVLMAWWPSGLVHDTDFPLQLACSSNFFKKGNLSVLCFANSSCFEFEI